MFARFPSHLVAAGVGMVFLLAAAGSRGWGQPSAPPAAERPPSPPLRTVRIADVPHVRQRPDFCGEACAAMYLGRLGYDVTQDDIFNVSGVDPAEGRGCHTAELKTALERTGFRTGPGWYYVRAQQAGADTEALFRALHADLVAGVPSIVCMRYDAEPDAPEHFRLILGYDAGTDEVLYHEPAEARGAYRRIAREEFLALWPLKYEAARWLVVRLRLEPGTIRRAPRGEGFSKADYAQHVRRLKERIAERLPEAEMHIFIERPFVVIGDGPRAEVQRYAEGTVRWAVERLKRLYFEKDPRRILDIWLFQDRESYEENAKQLFGRKPDTPFGYFSHRDGALVMNISTGGGTLVHEIVHPLVDANFPQCPAWFNEGLGSLYEQCGEYRGQIWGYTNWRLAGLQEAIRDEEQKLPSFKELCETTTREFYDEDPGTNYAQARYLCYYLQQQGLLVKYYHEFRRNAERDPSGYATLRRILGEEDMEAFQRRWEAYVLQLRFP